MPVRRPSPRKLAVELSREGLSYQEEVFTLRGGGESHWYFDGKKATSSGRVLRKVGALAVVEARRLGINRPNICAMGIGGYALMHGMTIVEPSQYDLTWAYKGSEDDPDNGLRGSSVEGKTVLLVDDVLTTGSSLVDTVTMIREAGGKVTDALVLVTRSSGLAETRLKDEQNIACHALFKLSEKRGIIMPIV